MGWNPNDHTPTKGQADYDQREIPAGTYLLMPGWLRCPTERSWKARFDVLAGPMKGARCFVLQGRDISKAGTANRFYYYAQSADLDAEIETEGTALAEHSLREHVLGHAIKAKVTKKKRGEYVDYDFARFYPRSEWSKEEREVAEKAEAEFADRRESEGYNDGSGSGDWSGNDSGGFDDEAPMPDGDDEWGGGDWG